MAGYTDFGLCARKKKITRASLIARGVGQEYWQSLSYLPVSYWLDRTRLRQRNKMAKNKQCKKLGGSRNADLTAPQGVTCHCRQNFADR